MYGAKVTYNLVHLPLVGSKGFRTFSWRVFGLFLALPGSDRLGIVPMPTKSPDEVPETVQREMTEIIYRVRGTTVTRLLREAMSESDRKWLEEHLTDEERERIQDVGRMNAEFGKLPEHS